MVKSPWEVEGEVNACSWGPPEISLKGSRVEFPGGQWEQRIRQHKLLKVFYFNGGTLALGMRGNSLQLTKTSSVRSIRNISDNLGMLSDSPTVAWRTYLGPSIKYKMEFLLISETNFFFSTLLSPPLLALRQISVSPAKQKEIHKWRATIRNSHQGILAGSKIFAASRISLAIGISLELTICQLPLSWLPASTKAGARDWIQLDSWQLCQILGTHAKFSIKLLH